MKPGETVETAIWLCGTETPEDRKRFEADVSASIATAQEEHGVMVGPIVWTEKRPGDDRVPPVPDHIQGPDVRLLVAEAAVLMAVPMLPMPRSFFTDDLESDDLARLRRITRAAYTRQYPIYPPLTDRQCDTLINDLGPDAAMDTLRSGTVALPS